MCERFVIFDRSRHFYIRTSETDVVIYLLRGLTGISIIKNTLH